MSRGFNKVILMGNLARDPDVRYTPSKQKVARITVAIGRQWKSANGEVQNQTDFVPVVLWGSLADICERYLRKGRPVLIEGRISVRDFDDPKSGQHRWITEVVASGLTLLSGGRREDDASPYPTGSSRGSFGDFGSLRDDKDFGDEFPMDISTLSDGDEDQPDIPF
jgi:single-strand DNA-binding protein